MLTFSAGSKICLSLLFELDQKTEKTAGLESDGWIHTVCVCACVHSCIYACVCVCVCDYRDGWIHTVCVHACAHAYMHVFVCVCMTTETDPGCCDGFQ